MRKVSVIIPVYKAEQYLDRCVESVLAQNFTDFELILIDDGSPDNSGKICDDWAKKDDRVRVIHQENKGASAARNRGIAESTGEYLMFCDSDDAVSDKWIERLTALADKDTLVMGAYCRKSEFLGKEQKLAIKPQMKYSSSDYYIFNQAGIAGFLCNAVYRRDIVVENGITLREQHSLGDYNEDLIFNLQYASKIKNIVYTGYSDYLYDVRSDSLSHSFDKYYFIKYLEKYNLWKSYINETANDTFSQLKELSAVMLYHFLVALQMTLDNSEGYKAFKSIVESDEMQEIIGIADTSKENPKIIELIKNKKTLTLYLRYRLQNLKRRCKK